MASPRFGWLKAGSSPNTSSDILKAELNRFAGEELRDELVVFAAQIAAQIRDGLREDLKGYMGQPDHRSRWGQAPSTQATSNSSTYHCPPRVLGNSPAFPAEGRACDPEQEEAPVALDAPADHPIPIIRISAPPEAEPSHHPRISFTPLESIKSGRAMSKEKPSRAIDKNFRCHMRRSMVIAELHDEKEKSHRKSITSGGHENGSNPQSSRHSGRDHRRSALLTVNDGASRDLFMSRERSPEDEKTSDVQGSKAQAAVTSPRGGSVREGWVDRSSARAVDRSSASSFRSAGSRRLRDGPMGRATSRATALYQFFEDELEDEIIDGPFLVTFVHSAPFDYGSMCCILLYAIFLCVQTDYRAKNWDKENPKILEVAESFFCLVFVCELVLRVYAYGCTTYFFGKDRAWNVFDCLIVVMQATEQVMRLFMSSKSHEALGILRTMRILRIVRSLRLIRMVFFIQELRTLILSVVSALRCLAWTVVLMAIWMFIVGMALTQLVTECRHHVGKGEIFERFGSMLSTVLTLYEVISGGLDWSDAVELLRACSLWPVGILIFYVTITFFGLMNVITSLFVKSVMETTEGTRRTALAHQMAELLNATDEDHNGSVTLEEFRNHLHDARMEDFLRDIDMAPEDAEEIFTLIDTEENGNISADAFLNGCLRLQGNAKAIDLEIYMQKTWRHMRDLLIGLESMEALLVEEVNRLRPVMKPSSIGGSVHCSPRNLNPTQDDMNCAPFPGGQWRQIS